MDSSNYLGNTPAYGLFQLQILAGDGSTTLYDLDYTVSSPTQLLVSVDGIIPVSYTHQTLPTNREV